jgi:phosphate transport system protein
MERHRDQELEKIRQSLLRMGGLVERMISEAMASLVERDTSRAQAVIRTDGDVDEHE